MAWLVRTIAIGAITVVVACASIAGIEDPVGSADETAPGKSSGGSTSSGATSSGASSSSSSSSGTTTNASSSSSTSSSSSSSSTSSSNGGASTSSSGAPDSGDDGAVRDSGVANCTLKQTNESCAAGADCCSTHCRQNFKCQPDCKGDNAGCDIGSSDSCCLGFYCGGIIGMNCVPCIPSGTQAATVFQSSVHNRYSCCSQKLDNGGFGPNCSD